jgi:hypothetical protein
VNPFAALGLPESADLTDEQVRAAWRQVAATTHPDRDDGGNLPRYTAATAAYAQLRTAWGRSEVLADLAAARAYIPPTQSATVPPPGITAGSVLRSVRLLPARVRHGRPLRLAIRAIVAAAVALLAVTTVAGTPAVPAITAGAALWWALTARADLAPPPGR